jgi:prepilin-type N-terminal cleavage/methylation domain-containing protein
MTWNHGMKSLRRALTLTELLVVMAILGILTLGAVPAVEGYVARASDENTRETLALAWRLALAHAQAQQRVVVLRFHADANVVQIQILDADQEVLWKTRLTAQNVTVGSNSDAQLLVYPHGLLSPVRVNWNAGSGATHMEMPDGLPVQEAP